MKFNGAYAAMLTPYDDDNEKISKERLENFCEFLILKGINGLFAFGTTGEWLYISDDQRKIGAEIIINYVNKRVPVIIHTGSITLEKTIELSLHAKSVNADAISIISPIFYPMDETALFYYFYSIANELKNFPIFIYNIPSRVKNDISPDLLYKIAKKADNVIGIKFSSNNLIQFREYRKKMGKKFNIFVGSDNIILPSLFEGGDGYISGTASVFPEILTNIYYLYKEGKLQEAALSQQLVDKLGYIIKEDIELSIFKIILRMRGIEMGDVKRPLRDANKKEIEKICKQLKLFKKLLLL